MVDEAVLLIASGFEAAGVAAILLVSLAATARFARRVKAGADRLAELSVYRADLGRGVLLGLELLVAADILGTVAVSPTFENLGVLGLVVLIRTFLSVSLSVEIEGAWPWHRRTNPGAPAGRSVQSFAFALQGEDAQLGGGGGCHTSRKTDTPV